MATVANSRNVNPVPTLARVLAIRDIAPSIYRDPRVFKKEAFDARRTNSANPPLPGRTHAVNFGVMRVTVFSSKPYDVSFLGQANRHGYDLAFLQPRLEPATVSLAAGARAVCAFVNDDLSAPVLEALKNTGVGFIALRSAGFNHVDIPAAKALGIRVARVPAYSPHAVAEHAVALILGLNRQLHRAWNRVREGNFSLAGLMGFDLQGRTVGVVGTGKIGKVFARIMLGFGCKVVATDTQEDP